MGSGSLDLGLADRLGVVVRGFADGLSVLVASAVGLLQLLGIKRVHLALALVLRLTDVFLVVPFDLADVLLQAVIAVVASFLLSQTVNLSFFEVHLLILSVLIIGMHLLLG